MREQIQLQTIDKRSDPNPSVRCKFAIIALAFCLLSLSSQPAAAKLAQELAANTVQPTSSDAPDIEQLLADLNSPKFSVRENATNKLAKLDGKSLKPLALQFIESSTESSWRIKRAIESIGIQGDEETFFKSTAILQLLVRGDNVEMSKRIVRLQKNWKLARRNKAIDKLKKFGAEIVDYSRNQQLRQQGMQVFSRNVPQPPPAPPKRKPLPKYDDATKIEKLNEVFANSLDENRDLVLENLDSSPEATQAQNTVTVPVNQIWRNQVIVRNGRVVQANAAEVVGGLSVKIGKKWKGNDLAFEELTRITDLRTLEFEKQPIGSRKLALINRLSSVVTIVFDDCAFTSEASRAFKWPASVQAMTFKRHQIDSALIKKCAERKQIKSLSFESCVLSAGAITQLKSLRSVSSLTFKDTVISPEMFDAFARIPGLTMLQLSECQFKIPDYRKFERKRPNVVQFTPRAFLGVRGPRTVGGLDNGGCVITEVIPGSGAEKGGLKTNDVIERIDGDLIEEFDDLRVHVAQHAVGDILKLDVMRAGEKVKLKIKLGAFADAPEN